MLSYILSKANMLILALGLFLITLYFATSWSTLLTSHAASEVVAKISEKISQKINSEAICSISSRIPVPRYLSYTEFLGGVGRYFYKIIITTEEANADYNFLIIKAVSRRDPSNVIASSSMKTKATIYLFEFQPNEIRDLKISNKAVIDPQAGFTIDPMATIDALAVVGEIQEGQKFILIIPCSTRAGWCEDNLKTAKTLLHSEGFDSKCLPS
ncbi:MAG: hypothetical protein J7L14_03960 [Candidatus Diapherotrites archaeon]|nr:hypothetical protein [Candidatus Diapherotrites archaeon]